MLTLFQQIDTFLTNTQCYWRFEPFHCSAEQALPWSDPDLQTWLLSLSKTDIDTLKSSPPELLEQLSRFIPPLAEMHAAITLNKVHVSAGELSAIRHGVPGRKYDQVRLMGGAALASHTGNEWLEWCAGKGYLGRVLAQNSQQRVTSFEYQQDLCQRGQAEADALGLDMDFIQGDAFDTCSQAIFHPAQHAVALHACGDLHVRLLQYATRASLCAITLSPCCYHLIHNRSYQPLSSPARQSALELSRSELRIPLQETVTGGERVKRHRFEEMSYRLGLDELIRHELAILEYIPVPSVKKSQLGDGFGAFCRWAAERKALTLPDTDFDHYQARGEQRFWLMERLSLVQHGFRRLLEMWLVLDKALYLQQHGYTISVSEFCDRHTTPRNILIHAEKRAPGEKNWDDKGCGL